MKIHDISKAFKCDLCLKVFSRKLILWVHYKTHTGEKPYACQVFDRKFARKDCLIRHQATYSEASSYNCSICPEDRYFKTKLGSNHHMVFIMNQSLLAVIVTI